MECLFALGVACWYVGFFVVLYINVVCCLCIFLFSSYRFPWSISRGRTTSRDPHLKVIAQGKEIGKLVFFFFCDSFSFGSPFSFTAEMCGDGDDGVGWEPPPFSSHTWNCCKNTALQYSFVVKPTFLSFVKKKEVMYNKKTENCS